MKEFISAVEDAEKDAEREEKIKALIAEGKSREDAEAEVDEIDFVEFKLDGRVLRAYSPTPGQLTYLLAATGRGQTQEQRYAGIVNMMFECLRDEDKDYFEGRLLTKNRRERLSLTQLEEIFEYLTEEWFARPTKSPSDSVTSQ